MSLLRCPVTQQTYPLTHTSFRGPTGAPLALEHPEQPVHTDTFDQRLIQPAFPFDSGVWRFKELIHPTIEEAHIVSRPEGNTPLMRAPTVAQWAGVSNLRLKHEGLNPSGSFKDRGMTVAVSQARAVGASAVACASTGNTSASMAAYAALAGLPAIVLVPAGKIATGKLIQALAYGAHTLLIRGDFDDAMRLVEQLSLEHGLYLVNSLNPFRLEGQKSIVFEMLQQCAWQAPDWIALPAGNLGNTSAFGAALVAAKAHGLISKLPRLLAVQAAGSAPFAHAFDRGFDALQPVHADTLASAIRIGNPVSYDRAVSAIRATDGRVVAVSDEAILRAKAVIDSAGVGAEPASCASVAGVQAMRAQGVIQPEDHVICVLTGHLLKDTDTTLAFHEGQYGDLPGRNTPIEVDGTASALSTELARILSR